MAKWRDTALIKGCVACQRDQRAETCNLYFIKPYTFYFLARTVKRIAKV